MKNFKEFISELYNVPLANIEKIEVDLDNDSTINELNKNLAISLSKDFSNIGDGLNAAKKILTMYGIELPQINFKDLSKGKGIVSIPIGQYKSSGANTFNINPPFGEKNENHIFKFTYQLGNGVYDIHAEVTKK